jgi:hypothetical protein
LQGSNFDPFAAAWIAAAEHVVDTHHVVAGRFESNAIVLRCPWRQRWFLLAGDPADLILGRLFTRGAVDGVRFRFRLLGEKVSFLQGYSPLAAIPGLVIRIGSRISVRRFDGSIFFFSAISRIVRPVLDDSFAIAAAAS